MTSEQSDKEKLLLERATYVSHLIHTTCDLIAAENEIDEQLKAEIELGLKLALMATIRWRTSCEERHA